MSQTFYTVNPEVMALVRSAYPNYHGKKISVTVCDPETTHNVASYWDNGYRDYFVFISLADHKASVSVPQQSAFDKPIPGADRAKIPFGVALVIRHMAGTREYVSVMVRSDNMSPNMLPPKVDLTDSERACLSATRRLKNTYAGETDLRRKSTDMTTEAWKTVQASLIAKGLLDNRGAITDNGRNALG